MSGLLSLVEAQTSATHASASVIFRFALGPRCYALTVALHWLSHACEIFECTHLKFTVSDQSIDTHMCVECSHASVELTQARPNHTVS